MERLITIIRPSTSRKGEYTPSSQMFPMEKHLICGLYSTCASPVVPHLSTRHAHGCLASEIGRDPAFPTRYDRTENSSRVASPDSDAVATRPPNEFKLLNIVELDTDEIIMLLSIVNLSS